jgi:phosphatidylinositol glycan class B
MNLFGRTIADVPEPLTRRVVQLFVLLFLAGCGLRALASFQTIAIIFPDEHQQFLEQAQRLVYGYGHHFWEQERGVRHPVYPVLLAIPLASCEALGIRDTLVQGALLRWTVSVVVLLACTLFAWEFHRRGDTTAALLLMSLFALMPDVIFSQIHPLSETGATAPYLLALVLLDRRPFWSGLLLGLSFGIRFQMGFIIGPTVFLAWLTNRGRIDRPFVKLVLGSALALFVLGLSDKMVYGSWFHSPLQYYEANMVEGIANYWGVAPWYQYVLWLGEGGWMVVAPLAVLAVVGIRREPALALLVAGFVVPHMLIGHKEARFLLPVAPLVLALIAVGFSEISRQLFDRRFRTVMFTIAAVALAAVAVVRFPQIRWNNDPYRPTAELLHAAGARPDLTGIVVLGMDRTECANYFYLRRDVPLVVLPFVEDSDLRKEPAFAEGRINYLIFPAEDVGKFGRYRPEEVGRSGRLALYRLHAAP